MLKYLKQSITYEKSTPVNYDENNDPTKDFFNLEQGKQFNRGKVTHNNDTKNMRVRMNLIEGFENNEDDNTRNYDDFDAPLKTKIEHDISEIKTLEDKFKQSLTEYSTLYKSYMEEMLKSSNRDKLKYNNRNIITPSGIKYYVNSYGIASEYNNKTWSNKHTTCDIPSITVESDNLPSLGLFMGKPMTENKPCGFEGKNVQIQKNIDVKENLCAIPGTVASQSTNYNAKNSFPASNAIDGDFNNFSHTSRGVGNWLQIKFPKEYFITNIVIHNRLSCCRYRFSKVKLQVYDSNQNIKFEKMIISDNPDTQILFTVDNIDVKGRSVRLIQYTDNVDDNQLSVGEIQVYGTSKEITNNGSIGFVDDKGVLHPYPNNDMTNKTGTCNEYIEDIDDKTWSKFTKGDDMTPMSLCSLGSFSDVSKKAQLVKLNNDLIEQSQSIYSKIQGLQTVISRVKNLESNKVKEVNEQLNTFQTLYDQYNKINKNQDTLDAMVNDNSELTTSDMYYYILWSIIAVIMMIMAVRQMK